MGTQLRWVIFIFLTKELKDTSIILWIILGRTILCLIETFVGGNTVTNTHVSVLFRFPNMSKV